MTTFGLWLHRWRFILAALALAALMLVLVLVLQPSWQNIALCFLAWFGGVACCLAAQSYGDMTRARSVKS